MPLPSALSNFVIASPDNPARLFGGLDKTKVAFLRFDSEAAANAAFAALDLIVPKPGAIGQTGRLGTDVPLAGDMVIASIGTLSVIGTIYNDDAVWGPPGANGFPTLTTQPTAKAGWHVNVLAT